MTVVLFLLTLSSASMRLGGILQSNSHICLQLSPPENLLRFHWECLFCLDLLVLNTGHQSSIDASYLQVYSIKDNWLVLPKSSDSDFEKVPFNLRISSGTFLLAWSSLLCKDKTIGIFVLLILSSDSFPVIHNAWW